MHPGRRFALRHMLYELRGGFLLVPGVSIVRRIALETEAVIDALFDPEPADHASTVAPPQGDGARLRCFSSGYIQYVDLRSLVATAKGHDVCFRLSRAVGQFVPKGGTLATVFPASRGSVACERAALRAFHVAAVRTMEDDVEFGVLQIVDIALKAISPAVNEEERAELTDRMAQIERSTAVGDY